jgi:peptide/nickel transport system permease protein
MEHLGRYLASRLVQAVVTLWVIVTMVFFMFRLAPGDPSAYFVDPTFPPEVKEQILRNFGLDGTLGQQYARFFVQLVQGDLGRSFFYGRDVTDVLFGYLWNTVVLSLGAFVVAYVLALVFGTLAAARSGGWLDNVLSVVTLFFRSAPVFWIAMLALMLFSFNLGWFPGAGMRDPGYEAGSFLEKILTLDFLHHLVLPAVVSGLYFWALPFLLVRNTTVEVMGEDFVELARATGERETSLLFRHGLRNSLLPVVTSAGSYFAMAAGGMVVIEVVFSWPGLGREIVSSVTRHDYPVAQGAFLFMAVSVLVMSIVVDLIYGYVDPRIRVGAGTGE